MALKRAKGADQVKAWRRARRAQLVARRLAVGAATRRRWSATIVDFLRAGFPSLAARTTIGVYAPFRGEPDVRAAVDHWRRAGATTALPVVVSRDAPLEFRAFGPGVRMRKGVFGLPIPQGTPVVAPQTLLIPSVGFDAAGYRLGHGGGYFDRTLGALAPPPLKIGIAFELSRIATIRPQAHDIAMDFIVTEAGIHAVTAAGLELVSDSRRIGAITLRCGPGAPAGFSRRRQPMWSPTRSVGARRRRATRMSSGLTTDVRRRDGPPHAPKDVDTHRGPARQ